MASQVETLAREQRTRQTDLGDLLVGELRALWVALFAGRAVTSADAGEFAAAAAPLIQQYGQAASAIAEEFYRRMRVSAGLPDTFDVPSVDPAPTEQIDTSVAWAFRNRPEPATSRTTTAPDTTEPVDLDKPLPERQFTELSGAAKRLAAQPGRSTLERAIEEDPDAVAWVRITDADPCGFCAMLAGRGAIYLSEESARFIEGTREPYHDHCDCVPAPRFRDDLSPLPATNQKMQDLWYKTGAYFSNEDARNAMDRAVRALKAGRDPVAAAFEGPAGNPDKYRRRITHDAKTVDEFRRKAQRGGRNGKRNTPDYAGDPRFR